MKWIPYNKGGDFRKWYGNNSYVVNWENDGYEIKENTKLNYPKLGENLGWKISNEEYYYKKGITWSGVTSGDFSCRCYEDGFIFDSGANGLFAYEDEMRYYLAGILNSSVGSYILKMLNPTINTGSGTINQVPIILDSDKKTIIINLVKECINISKIDWDSYESSWDFKKHPLVGLYPSIKEAYYEWSKKASERFNKLKSYEEDINEIVSTIYGVSEEVKITLLDKEISINKANLKREVRSLISYAIGCIFGRYSIDCEGLAFAGGKWNPSYYETFIPDKDNILPITDEEYFQDDLVGLFVRFIKVVYGENSLEENLEFIAQFLGGKGENSREILRNYFIKDFFKDHCDTFSITGSGKRPIYLLFDSGKQNGFKALVYLHRYDENTIGNLRIDYLHRMQRIYENEIARMQDTIENSRDAREVAAATKRKEKLIKQLQETKEYDEKISHLALSRTSIDLDDGVKVNYEKIQTDRDGKKLDVLAKI